jgi:predicted PurR-regulated permease PerM
VITGREGLWRGDDLLPYLRRLILTIIVVGLVAIAVWLRYVLLLAFAAVLVAIALGAVAGGIGRITRLGPRLSLTLAILIALGLIVALVSFSWPLVREQLPTLLTRLEDGLRALENTFGIEVPQTAQEATENGYSEQLWAGLVSLAGTVLGAISAFALVLIGGVFLAAEAARYRDGFILLFPISWHGRVRRALSKAGEGLHLWLRAQAIAMTMVGTLIGLGAWAIGLPGPVALGLLAGLAGFVPIIGPIIAMIPALVVAIGEGGAILLWTAILYLSVQQLEANLVTPLLQRKIVRVPPVVLLFSIVSLAFIFGVPGVIVAAPLTATLYILIREFYVKDLLGEGELMSRAAPEGSRVSPAVADRAHQPAE